MGDSASRKQQRGNAGNDETSTHRAGKQALAVGVILSESRRRATLCSRYLWRVFGSLGVSAGAEQACKNVHSLQKLACGGSARAETVMLSAEQYQYTFRIFSA